MELLCVDESIDSQSFASDQCDEVFLTLSLAAVTGKPSPKTMCMSGTIQGIPIDILVDSGTSHTFLSESLASQLQGVARMHHSISVQMANGENCLASSTWFKLLGALMVMSSVQTYHCLTMT